jgi:hypothetical protein
VVDLDGAPMIALLAMVVDPENKATTPINPNQPPINHQSMSEKKEIQGTPTTFPNTNNHHHHHHHLPAITTLAVRSKAVLPNTLFTTMLLTEKTVEKSVEKRIEKSVEKESRKVSRKESGGLNYVQQRTANINALPVLPELKATCNVPVASGTGKKKKKKE